MTTACFFMRGDDIVGFELSGHTGAGKSGSDILCAAVSSAAYLTANTITDVMNVKADIELSDGRLKLTLGQNAEKDCQALLKGFLLHMKQLREQNPNNIRIITISSGKEHYNA